MTTIDSYETLDALAAEAHAHRFTVLQAAVGLPARSLSHLRAQRVLERHGFLQPAPKKKRNAKRKRGE